MAPQELTLPGVAQRNRKAALTMSALFVLALCLIFIFARWYLHDSRAQLLREMGQDMNSQASGKVALLTVWSGTLAGQVNIFVTQDMLRLFAAEVASAGVPATDMLQMARQSQNGAEADTMPPAGTASNSDPLKKIAPRLPLMVDYLSDFMEKNSFSGASLVNTDMQMYLAPEGVQPPDEEQRPYLQQALNSKQPVLMPVRRENGRLVMDMAFPIFAPLYVDSTGDRVVSLLLATYSVLPVTAAATGEAGNGSQYNTFILQSFGEKLQRIAPTEVSGVSDLPGWSLHDEKLPLGTRIDPGLPEGEREIYGLALPVPNLPWLVEQTLPVSRIDERFAGIKQNVVVASLIMAALVGGLLAALWWSLVSRNERAVAEQMHKLYLVVNQQKQIMD
ncbi:MAG: histidine kinase, partial [Desulfovibrio desulfuricans]|nr:histidine kinase [Desulfovibrio desulfuricans]